ncbi:MAG: HEAT repeat domain-containing protein, partial [Deltaproteobacteria bacterium]|nr:HEAT repeat domain-containing protein [Deltaproteobacteria bacterium]
MAENTAEKKETAEDLPQEVSKEEVASATEVMLSVVKTSKAFRMYLANNPLLRRFLDDLMARLTSYMGKYGELKLDIDQFELKCKGKTVYESRDPKESLAFKLYSDGIRSLIFSEGIEGKEATDFLEIAGKDRPGEVDDDIVTLLWMKDLPHITCILAEDYLEFDVKGQAGSGGEESAQQEKIRGLYKDIPPQIEKLQTPMLIPQNIISLTEEEIEWLKTARELDEGRNALGEVAQVLFSILSVEKDFTLFGEFIDITVNLTGNLLHS